MCEQEAIKRLSRRPVHGDDDEEEELMKLRRFSGESAAIARLHDEGQASLAPRQLDDYELERAMVSLGSSLFGVASPHQQVVSLAHECIAVTIRRLHARDRRCSEPVALSRLRLRLLTQDGLENECLIRRMSLRPTTRHTCRKARAQRRRSGARTGR